MNRAPRLLSALLLTGLGMVVACGDDTSTSGAGGDGGSSTNGSSSSSKASTSGSGTSSSTASSTSTASSSASTSASSSDSSSASTSASSSDSSSASTSASSSDSSSSASGTSSSSGMMADGETCNAAIAAVDGEYTGSYAGFTSDYNPMASGCTGSAAPGADIAYAVTIPAGEELQAVLFPDSATDDVSIYVVTDCSNLTTCLVGSDVNGAGDGDAVFYTNPGATPLNVFVIVDAFNPAAAGNYTLFINTGDEATCDDFFDNDVDGEIDCGDAGCTGNADCAPGPGATGVACTANTNCAAVGNDPFCLSETLVGYPDGYCSDWCDTAADNCAGDGICLDVGLDEGLCFDGCTADANCRAEYYCDDGLTACVPAPAGCAAPATLAIGTTNGNTTTAPNDTDSTCTSTTSGSGNEVIYSFVAGSTGTLTLTLDSASDQGLSVRSACADVDDELECVDDEFGGTDEVLTVPVTSGTTYFVIVQAWSPGDEGPYSVTAAIN